MRVMFFAESECGNKYSDRMYFSNRISKGVLSDVFNAWLEQIKYNENVVFSNSKYIVL